MSARSAPGVWTRAAQVDPDSPLRGRYLVLPLRVDACGLPKKDEQVQAGRSDVVARDGKLIAVENHAPAGGDQSTVWTPKNTRCDRAVLSPGTDLSIPDTAKMPSLKPGEELWVEVTVPPEGPPRAIQLAISGNGNFAPIKMN